MPRTTTILRPWVSRHSISIVIALIGLLVALIGLVIPYSLLDNDAPHVQYQLARIDRNTNQVSISLRVTASEQGWRRRSGIKSIKISDAACYAEESGTMQLECDVLAETNSCAGLLEFPIRAEDVDRNYRVATVSELIPRPLRCEQDAPSPRSASKQVGPKGTESRAIPQPVDPVVRMRRSRRELKLN